MVVKQKKTRKCSELLVGKIYPQVPTERWSNSGGLGDRHLVKEDASVTDSHRCTEDAIHRDGTYIVFKKNIIYWTPLPLLLFVAITKYLHPIQASMISIIYLLFLWWRRLRFSLRNTAVGNIIVHFQFLQWLEHWIIASRSQTHFFCDSLYTKMLLTMAAAYDSHERSTRW